MRYNDGKVWMVRYYCGQWSTSHSYFTCKTKKEAEKEARLLRKQDPHSHAKVVRRTPVTFDNFDLLMGEYS